MASVLHHNSGILIPRDEYEELTEALATVFRIGSRFTPRLIERLDLIDGDSDFEGLCDEDEISRATDWGSAPTGSGPGCMIADPDEGVDDKGEMIDEREPDEGDSPQPIIGGGSGDYPGGDAA